MSNVALSDRRNTIVGVVGRKGSGKSALIADVLGPRHPRRVTFDWTGESRELYPHATTALGLADTLHAMEELHRADPRAWHVISVIDPDDAGLLLSELAPRYAPGVRSLSGALGGVCVECGEIDVIAPVSGAGASARAVTDAIARGRHHRLSFLWATQRPHQCARILSSQLDTLIAFRMHEPRDIMWLARAAGPMYAGVVQRSLAKYWSAWFDAETGEITVQDADRKSIAMHRAAPLADGQLDL